MIRSMTAYASGEGTCPLRTMVLELRSVNHRYLEQHLRLPEALRRFEPALRSAISAALGRGKVDVNVRIREGEGEAALEVNEPLLDQLGAILNQMDAKFPTMRVSATDLLAYPGVLRTPRVDDDVLEDALLSTLDDALDSLIANRQREGEKLAQMITVRLDQVAAIVEEVETYLPQVQEALQQRLQDKLAELDVPVDPGRLEQELVLQINRADVAEELDRLNAHIGEAQRILEVDEPVGRRLDFLMQEFNREANTLGSKAVDVRLTNAAMELKVLIEQMREQVQNIE